MYMRPIVLTKVHTAKFHESYVVDLETGCWNWTGHLAGKYPYLSATVDGVRGLYRAHRYSYTLLVGPIPEGLTLDHECVNPPCVNPEHLSPVTHAENSTLAGLRQTHCKHGHEYTAENTIPMRNGRRGAKCRACQRSYQRAISLGVSFEEALAREAELDSLYAETLPPKPERPTKFIKVDWSNPLHCLNCAREMRPPRTAADGRTSYGARGLCARCYS